MNALADIASHEKPRALVSPWADFWLVGGASGLAFMLFVVMTDVLGIQVGNSPAYWAFALSFAVNDPHFIYSYFLFYKGFFARVFGPGAEFASRARHIMAGIVVPAVMALFLVVAIRSANEAYVHWAVIVMTFTVGWHYVKQGYGVLITLSLYEGVFYSAIEKRILWINAYAVWIASVILLYSHGIPHAQDGLPAVGGAEVAGMQNVAFVLAGVPSLLALAVLIKHAADGKGASCNAITGYGAAVYMWIMMPIINFSFYALVPMFHSLQYLPFVYKYKKSEFARQHPGAPRAALKKALLSPAGFAAGGIAVGAVFFELLPKFLDRQAAAGGAGLHPSFFFIMFLSFINIHHYFIDSAFWRRDNEGVQQNLFRA